MHAGTVQHPSGSIVWSSIYISTISHLPTCAMHCHDIMHHPENHTSYSGPSIREQLPSTLVVEKTGRSTSDIIETSKCNVESGVTFQVLQITTKELAAG